MKRTEGFKCECGRHLTAADSAGRGFRRCPSCGRGVSVKINNVHRLLDDLEQAGVREFPLYLLYEESELRARGGPGPEQK